MSEYAYIHLPLYPFFEALRKKGSQLGMDEYFAFLEALGKGFGIEDVESLYQTCKLLWFNPGDSAIQFRELFQQYWEEEISAYEPKSSTEGGDDNEDEVDALLNTSFEDPQKKRKEEGRRTQTRAEYDINAEDEKDKEGFPPIVNPPEQIVSQETEASLAQPKLQISIDASLLEKSKASISREELEEVLAQYRFLEQPFSSKSDLRKIALSWRHLWKPTGTKTGEQVNIEETIEEIARSGGRVREIIYHKEESYEAKLMILLDDSKSMVAFKEQAEQMLGIIAKEIDAEPERYYFSDLALDRFFLNRSHTEAIKVSELKSKYFHKGVPVLIISDGGAARGTYSKENIIKVYQGIGQIKGFATNIAWLNPMSRERWNKPQPTSAWYINDRVVSMFDFSNAEVQAAVNMLKGKFVNLQKS